MLTEFIQHMEDLADRIHQCAYAHEFWPRTGVPRKGHEIMCACHMGTRNVGEMVALCHSELSEFLENFRKRGRDSQPDDHCPDFTNQEIELADTIIRIMDLAHAMDMRLGAAIVAKVAFNETRPPKHGKAF